MDHAKSARTLQTDVKSLYNQRQSLFNQRSCFDGLRFRAQDGSIVPNGASFLSFQRFDAQRNANMTLRERIFSQLHDELPELDPTLSKYVKQFRIPDAELFLRMIRCPNLLALRELAKPCWHAPLLVRQMCHSFQFLAPTLWRCLLVLVPAVFVICLSKASATHLV